jgi:phage-related protein
MTVYEIYEKKTQKKPDRIVNIGKEKYEINSYEF